MENQLQKPTDFSRTLRWITGVVSVSGLLLIFFFQHINWSLWIIGETNAAINAFLVNRAVRFILNDILAVLLVISLFGKRKLAWIAVYVQVIGFVGVLIPYVILKLNFPQYNGPLISFLHRLVLNPLLIYLLIFFFWYEEKHTSDNTK